jgi:hypothetical protein
MAYAFFLLERERSFTADTERDSGFTSGAVTSRYFTVGRSGLDTS